MNQETSSRRYSNKFHIFPIAIFVALLGLYVSLSLTSFAHVQINRFAYLAMCIVMSILYLLHYRRKTLFCYETLFFSLYILCVFFADIVLNNIESNTIVSSLFYTSFSNEVENKGMIIQMLGFYGFMSAASLNNYRNGYIEEDELWISSSDLYSSVNYKRASTVMSIIVALYIVYLYFMGVFATWFHYSGNVSNYTNIEIVYCTMLCLVLSITELTKLNKQGCRSFGEFIRFSNKLCVFDIVLIFGLLLISGNRNESLLILLPAIVGYSSLISKITNRQFFIGLIAGVIVMTFIGVIRHFGFSQTNEVEFSLYEATRDFGLVDINTRYLINYVDQHGPIFFGNAIMILFSSVPFLGGIIASITGFTMDTRSTQLTTDGMQFSYNMDSGLGTSLIGDLYYTGSFLFVLIFMIAFGWFVSSMHNRFVIKKIYNPWLLIFYIFNFANVAYFIRAEWTMPFRYLGFACLIFFFITLICKKQ